MPSSCKTVSLPPTTNYFPASFILGQGIRISQSNLSVAWRGLELGIRLPSNQDYRPEAPGPPCPLFLTLAWFLERNMEKMNEDQVRFEALVLKRPKRLEPLKEQVNKRHRAMKWGTWGGPMGHLHMPRRFRWVGRKWGCIVRTFDIWQEMWKGQEMIVLQFLKQWFTFTVLCSFSVYTMHWNVRVCDRCPPASALCGIRR